MKTFFCAITFAFAIAAGSVADLMYQYDAEQFHVESSTDGNGLFQYTFSSSEANSFQLSAVSIQIDATLVDSIESPNGWASSISSQYPHYIRWSCNDLSFLDNNPLTFSVQCSVSESTISTNGSAAGIQREENGLSRTYSDTFSYIQPIPEPSSVALLLAGGGALWLARRKRFR